MPIETVPWLLASLSTNLYQELLQTDEQIELKTFVLPKGSKKKKHTKPFYFHTI